jgi:hypothetical protein
MNPQTDRPTLSTCALVRRATALLAAVMAAVLLFGASTAFAATYDPSAILSDDNFRAVYSMSAADVQAFLVYWEPYAYGYGKTSSETPDAYYVRTGTFPALRYLSVPDVDGVTKSAAEIIYEAAVSNNISPRVMLVMLQKEQSLVQASNPSANTLSRAVGAGCPDGGGNKYPGFANQVRNGARLLSGYCEVPGYPNYGMYRPGVAMTIDGQVLHPMNVTTYKLYVYNPHLGGNQNFWTLWNRYFGDPMGSAAIRPVYRFYNLKNGTHFYTISDAERYAVLSTMASTYHYDGVVYSVNASSTANTQPLYRFYNPSADSHFYTASESEKANVIANLGNVYRYEGPAYMVSSDSSGTTPVFRFFNVRTGTHFYTASTAERDSVIQKLGYIFHYEGPAFYLGN